MAHIPGRGPTSSRSAETGPYRYWRIVSGTVIFVASSPSRFEYWQFAAIEKQVDLDSQENEYVERIQRVRDAWERR